MPDLPFLDFRIVLTQLFRVIDVPQSLLELSNLIALIDRAALISHRSLLFSHYIIFVKSKLLNVLLLFRS